MYVATPSRRGLGQYSILDLLGTNPFPAYKDAAVGVYNSVYDYVIPNAGGSLASGKTQIQSVPANAAAANAAAVAAGMPAPYDVPAIQVAADQASSAFAAENAQIWAVSPTDPTTWPWYYWLGIAGVGILLLVDFKK